MDNRLASILRIVSYSLISLVILLLIRQPSLVDPRLGAVSMMNFNAHKPFQYRILIPAAVDAVNFVIPDIIKHKIENIAKPYIERKAENCTEPELKAKYYVVSENIVRILIYFILNFLVLLGFLIVIRKLLIHFKCLSPHLASLCPITFVFIMPIFFEFPNYIYDFAHLFLFTAGLYFLFTRSWLLYFIAFTLGVLNKETAAMLTVIYAFAYYKELEKSGFYKLLAGQVAIFGLIKFILFLIFRNNPGSIVEFHLMHNLGVITNWRNLFRFEPLAGGFFLPSRINIIYPRGINLPLLVLVIFLSAYGWRRKPLLLRKSTIYFPLLICVALTMGSVPELRAYYDVLPITFLLGVMGVNLIWKDIKEKLTGGINVG